jgi:dolichol-phosphate mannosyltransferase
VVTPVEKPSPAVSLIIPALNEAENLTPLCEGIAAVLGGRRYEILIVDDNSRDRTPEVCAELSGRYPLRLIVRTVPKDGLSGAVLAGIAEARGDVLVVMDADLQHPPSKLPELIAPLESGEADFVLGSRYMPGGSTGEKWTLFRRINSRVATFLARPFAGSARDPMSGFFALRRETFDRARRLTPLGYKIGLELMCKCRVARVREVPIHFAARTRGRSKLTLREQFRYLEHLSRLYDFTFPRASPVVKFAIVIAVSWMVGLVGVMALLALGARSGVAVALSYPFVLFATAVFHFRYIRTQREFLVTRRPWAEFLLVAGCEWIACMATVTWVAYRAQYYLAELVLIAYGVATVVRYVLRKELMQDIRGLRKEIRKDELE